MLFYKQHFYKQRQAEIGKNLSKWYVRPRGWTVENYSHTSSTLSSKNNRTHSKKYAKEQVYLYSWDYTINSNENEDENEGKIPYILHKPEY